MPIDPDMHGLLMTALPEEELQVYGPWNPGVESALPSEFLALSTVFSSANVSSSIDELQELNGFCGLGVERLSAFRPERLALHEVLIRVMADLSVPDGEKYEDLGVNFRRMTATILGKYIAPKMSEIRGAYDRLKREASDFIDKAQMAVSSLNEDVKETRDFGTRHWSRFFLPSLRGTQVKTAPAGRDFADIACWRTKAQSIGGPFEQACYQALVTTADAIFTRRGRLPKDRKLMTSIALRLVCNDYEA